LSLRWSPPKVLVFPARLLLLWRLMETWGVSGVPWPWGFTAAWFSWESSVDDPGVGGFGTLEQREGLYGQCQSG
jgi:hypothetical protein